MGPEYDKLPINVPAVAPKSVGKITIKTKNNKADFSYEMKESFRSQMEDLQIKYEQQLLQKTHPFLKDQRDRVLAQLKKKQKLADTHFVAEEEASKMTEEVLPLFIALAADQGELAATFAVNTDFKFELTPVMEKYIADSVAKATIGFTKDTQAKIATALADGINAGDSINTISNRISEIYDEVLGIKTPGYRIDRLARTEVIKTSNEITEAAYRQSGVVNKKEWFANPGKCEFCAALDGSVLQLGGTFVPQNSAIEGINGGTHLNSYEDVKHPPVHPQCRCTLIPVLEGN